MSSKPLNDGFYRELFRVYDTENSGYITVEKFLEISLENMSENDPDEEVNSYFSIDVEFNSLKVK